MPVIIHPNKLTNNLQIKQGWRAYTNNDILCTLTGLFYICEVYNYISPQDHTTKLAFLFCLSSLFNLGFPSVAQESEVIWQTPKPPNVYLILFCTATLVDLCVTLAKHKPLLNLVISHHGGLEELANYAWPRRAGTELTTGEFRMSVLLRY